jgi:hypothetical protein
MKLTTVLVNIPAITYTREAYTDSCGNRHKAKKVTRKAHKQKVRRRNKSKTSKEKKFFKPKVKSGWKKDMPVKKRRELELKAHKNNLLSASRAKQSLANVSTDRETKIEAEKDARYFLRLYHMKEGK